ncbi:ThiF family protein [Ascobolus immersus RN42]|uniref:Ubiquitin-activating enzyme E1-like n=1 Tax=Ascobolus immersus RN42 TaxID=1160509 RepID=A0A3N4IUY7_ASCIM|nr:ThiF family protein [Ascobolus immersus RN42]
MATEMSREVPIKKALGGTLANKIKNARVLMVGAGGIGCELLKNLVLTGFGEIHIVDLDTIDLSNLNRQFLFNMNHIKKPKAIVAKETAQKFNPDVKIEAYHSNIKDSEFDVEWYKGFHIVFNALDNLDARRYVNKMCLAANVPLIESGTTGFNGQVQAIKKGETECYDCTAKPVPKSFPVCTIRSTPSQPIHCIVWAKSYLFTEIFGTGEMESSDMDNKEDAENAEEIETLKREAQELKRIREKMGTNEFAKAVFQKVFDEDVQRLCSMEDMWKTRKRPTPLKFEEVQKAAVDAGIKSDIAEKDQLTWDVAQNFTVFVDSINRLSKRLQEEKANVTEGSPQPILEFDKDDVDTLDFVAAAANLRSHIFRIDLKSKFDIKQMAGNIIPAIATTNAITAGVCVLQAFKVMNDDLQSAKMVFLSKSADRIFSTERLSKPNPTCAVCSNAWSSWEVDTTRATLQDLLSVVAQKVAGYSEECIIMNGSKMVYDVDYEDNLEKPLADLDIVDNSTISIADDSSSDDQPQKANLELRIIHKDYPVDNDTPYAEPAPVEVPLKHVPVKAEKPVNGTTEEPHGAKRTHDEALGEDDPAAKKRVVNGDKAVPVPAVKKTKQDTDKDGDVVVLDEEEDDGVIEID